MAQELKVEIRESRGKRNARRLRQSGVIPAILYGHGKEDVALSVQADVLGSLVTGKVGDITAGLPPQDYSATPYLEWYGDENGRVVIELAPDQVEVIGKPIPACESDPISREQQQQNMAGFLAGISQAIGATAVAVGRKPHLVSDPKFTHWVVEQRQIVGEAHSVEPGKNGRSFAYVRLFNIPEGAEYGYIETRNLRPKNDPSPSESCR